MQLGLLWIGIGGGELVAIVVVVVLLFGASRIPAVARGIGIGVRELRDALRGGDEDKGSSGKEKESRPDAGGQGDGGAPKGG